MGFLTDTIHAGQEPEGGTGAVITPIYQTSTYAQKESGGDVEFDYSRANNPTRKALERNIAALEGGRFGCAFGSGMAAIASVAQLLNAGDHMILSRNVYGGTYRFIENVAGRHGLEYDFVDTGDLANVEAVERDTTAMLYIETPTNPMLTLTDLEAAAKLAHSRDWLLAVDNTFLSPYNQRPIEFGADLVIHSATKYLNGHSDVVLGLTVTDREDLQERLKFLQKTVGAVPGPFDSWLVLRSTKTLGLRMRQHELNARALAEFLDEHPKAIDVFYPGLSSHPQHELAKHQQRDPKGEPVFGGMISMELGSLEKAKRFLDSVSLFTLAESLGGVESLLSHPATMTHAAVPKEERLQFGLTDGLVRLSVGCEDTEDLLADLEHALAEL